MKTQLSFGKIALFILFLTPGLGYSQSNKFRVKAGVQSQLFHTPVSKSPWLVGYAAGVEYCPFKWLSLNGYYSSVSRNIKPNSNDPNSGGKLTSRGFDAELRFYPAKNRKGFFAGVTYGANLSSIVFGVQLPVSKHFDVQVRANAGPAGNGVSQIGLNAMLSKKF